MASIIDSGILSVQIESAREDRWVPDGFATSRGSQTKPIYFKEPEEYVYMTKVGSYDMPQTAAGDPNTPESARTVKGWAVGNTASWGVVNAAAGTITTTRPVALCISFLANLQWNKQPDDYDIYQGGPVGYRIYLPDGSSITDSRLTGVIRDGVGLDRVQDVPEKNLTLTALTPIIPTGSIIYMFAQRSYYLLPDTPPSRVLPGTWLEVMEYDLKEYTPSLPQNYVGSRDTGVPGTGSQVLNTITYNKQGQAPPIIDASIATEVVRDGDDVIEDYLSRVTLSRGVDTGPCILHSRLPTPVQPGDKVNFAGRWRVYKTGTVLVTDAGEPTGIDIRGSIWGVGWKEDEYGVDQLSSIELMHYQAPLQDSTERGTEFVNYKFPEISSATVPDWVTHVYLSFSYVETTTNQYTTATNVNRSQSINKNTETPPDLPSSRGTFAWSPSSEFPFTILIETATGYYSVETDLSPTNAAFDQRYIYDNVKSDCQLVFYGDEGKPVTISVYNYEDGIRGSLIGTYSTVQDERKVVNLSPSSPSIEIVSSDVFLVEYVLNVHEEDTLSHLQNRIERIDFLEILGDVSDISILRSESEPGSATINIVSSTLNALDSSLIKIGKRIRVLGKHDNGHSYVFMGTIKKIKTEYDYYEEEPITQIIAYDEGYDLDFLEDVPAFIDWKSYGPFFNKLGIDVYHNGFNWGGARGRLPDKSLYPPMPCPETAIKSLDLTRNTIKGYWFINAKNQLILLDEDSTETVIQLSDEVGANISYGEAKIKNDSSTNINVIQVIENKIDHDDYMKRTMSEEPPPMNFQYPQLLTERATYKNESLLEEQEENKISIPVVRSTGQYIDMWMSNYGPSFREWANEILDRFATTEDQITDITIPIKTKQDVQKVLSIDLLSPLEITYKGTVYNVRVKEIDMEIKPGKWTVKLQFSFKKGRSLWDVAGGSRVIIPPPPVIDPDPEEWLFVDDFERPNEEILEYPWNKGAATTFAIVGLVDGHATSPNNNVRSRYWYDAEIGVYQIVEVVLGEYPLVGLGSAAGILIRGTNSLDGPGIIAYIEEDQWAVDYFDGSSLNPSRLASGSHSRAAGDVIRGKATGDTLAIFINGVKVFEDSTLPENLGGYSGLFVRGAARIDSWRSTPMEVS